jgi:hypothetical protein
MFLLFVRAAIVFVGLLGSLSVQGFELGRDGTISASIPAENPVDHHSEDGCSSIAHVCGCCVSAFFADEPTLNEDHTMQTIALASVVPTDAKRPNTFQGKIFRPPIFSVSR